MACFYLSGQGTNMRYIKPFRLTAVQPGVHPAGGKPGGSSRERPAIDRAAGPAGDDL